MAYYIFTNNTPKLNVYVLGKLFTRGRPVIVMDILTRLGCIAKGLDYVIAPPPPGPPPPTGHITLESGLGAILLENGVDYVALER
jgi:hypothetical protein